MTKSSRNLSILASMLVTYVKKGKHSATFFMNHSALMACVDVSVPEEPQFPLMRRSRIGSKAILKLADARLAKQKIDREQQDKDTRRRTELFVPGGGRVKIKDTPPEKGYSWSVEVPLSLELADKMLAQNPGLEGISLKARYYGPRIVDNHNTLQHASNNTITRELYEQISAMAKKYSVTIKGLESPKSS